MAFMNGLLVFASLLGLSSCSLESSTPGAQGAEAARPRLVVVISIDQFRADYVTRFEKDYLPAKKGSTVGGFNFLVTQGAHFADAHYDHVPTVTGVGHGVITTGSIPALNGIADNEWFDRATRKPVYCVDDPSVKTVGGTANPMSPKNQRVTTVGDELKMATAGKAKVVGIALKDRASILLAGHAADTVIWFDSGAGGWVTSTFYAPSGKLPAWVEAMNGEKIPESSFTKTWAPILSDSAYQLTRPAPFVKGGPTSPVFSHPIAGSTRSASMGNFTRSGFAQEYVFETVKRALDAEGLGQDDVPDMLCINLATNDYVGHAYGPNSPEVMDISVRTDRLLSDLFNTLDKKVKGGLKSTAIVVTADHGVAPIPEESKDTYRVGHAIRGSSAKLRDAINAAMSAKVGEGKWVLYCEPPQLYLDRELLASKGIDLAEAQRLAAGAARSYEGIVEAFAGEDILRGALPAWPWTQHVANGYSRTLSGDVMIFETPGALFAGGTGTSHGSPWVYDAHVPILAFGTGSRAGLRRERVSVCDIAPTLSMILGIEHPSGSVGRILP